MNDQTMTAEHCLLFCTFYLGDTLYGISIEHVQEVGISGTTIPVPLAQDAVKGLMNLRGQIITLLDLRRILGLPPRPDSFDSYINVVVCCNNETFGIVVDRIGEVLKIDGTKLEALPSNVRKQQPMPISAIYTLPGSLLCILNLETLIQLATHHSLGR